MAAIRVLISPQVRLPIWDETDSDSLHVDQWEKSASLWPENWLAGEPSPLEVFLLLNGASLTEGYGQEFVGRIIEQAHQSMWGADIYVVLDSETSLKVPTLDQKRIASSPSALFEILSEANVTDVLQWPRASSDFVEASVRSRRRMQNFRQCDFTREWKCHLQKPTYLSADEESFLSRFLVRSLDQLKDQNCLIVLPEKRENYMRYIKKVLGERPAYHVMVGVIDQIDRPPRDLTEFCEENGYELLWFHGLIEMYYFLLKLNRIRLQQPKQLLGATRVPLVATPVFKSHAPQLLITHSFLRGKTGDAADAANDVWQLTRELGDDTRVKIYPAVQCIKLAEILDDLVHVLAWVHIGHGNLETGLQQSEDEIFKSAEDWLRSFAGYKSSLALALFSSCCSTPVAKRFAEAGAGVTIGFENQVPKKLCQYLTKPVIKKAIETNGSRNAILEAFRIGRSRIETQDKDALPKAFWSRH